MPRRVDRINQLLRTEISELLRREVNDPRLGTFITVTRVSTSPDLRHAKVFFSTYDDTVEKAVLLQVLSNASGFLRKELGSRLSLRIVPELSFHYDETVSRGARVMDILKHVSSTSDTEDIKEAE